MDLGLLEVSSELLLPVKQLILRCSKSARVMDVEGSVSDKSNYLKWVALFFTSFVVVPSINTQP